MYPYSILSLQTYFLEIKRNLTTNKLFHHNIKIINMIGNVKLLPDLKTDCISIKCTFHSSLRDVMYKQTFFSCQHNSILKFCQILYTCVLLLFNLLFLTDELISVVISIVTTSVLSNIMLMIRNV